MNKRAEGGSGSTARPDEKMGGLRDEPFWGTGKRRRPVSSRVRRVLKRVASSKRRQRDRLEADRGR